MIPLLKQLHKIKRIVLLDHRDCGAYNLILGKQHQKTRQVELESHKKVMHKAKKIIQDTYPELEVYCLLIGLDGIVENLS